MTVVALTGGIAAGKTTVTDVLSARGVSVIDADVLARNAVEPGSPGLMAIVERFGEKVVDSHGGLDRSALAKVIFADEKARDDLNKIVHPEVHRLSTEAFRSHEAKHPEVPLVYAVPLLVESGRESEFDAVVVIHTPRERRVERLIDSRQMDLAEATARVDAQATDQQRLAVATCVLDSSHSVADTRNAAGALADALWAVWPDVKRLPTSLP